jgi:hypothetical protein
MPKGTLLAVEPCAQLDASMLCVIACERKPTSDLHRLQFFANVSPSTERGKDPARSQRRGLSSNASKQEVERRSFLRRSMNMRLTLASCWVHERPEPGRVAVIRRASTRVTARPCGCRRCGSRWWQSSQVEAPSRSNVDIAEHGRFRPTNTPVPRSGHLLAQGNADERTRVWRRSGVGPATEAHGTPKKRSPDQSLGRVRPRR